MGKIYCTECGTEMDDSMNFCSNCGVSLNDKENTNSASDKVKGDKTISSNENSIKVIEESKKNNNSKYSTTTKVFLGIAGVCIIIFILGIILVGSSMMSPTDDTMDNSEDTSTLSPSFTDTIDGIDFQIPEGYETFDGTDNQNKGTMITYDRSYMGSDGNVIEIAVSTAQGNFYWDLTQNRDYDDVDKTINGHDGVLKSSGVFSYVTGDKLVVITGADEQQLENIIIE